MGDGDRRVRHLSAGGYLPRPESDTAEAGGSAAACVKE